jgi:creatinine amidohydrolase
MPLRPASQMLPHEILAARQASSCAFLPVSPCFEWHSFHLPMGTDALIAEGISRHMAEQVQGIYFEPLSFGLDEYRPKDQLLNWGFGENDLVFGMRFPDLPLSSEYSRCMELRAAVTNRIEAVQRCGFRYVFLINNHGGTGQTALLADIAREWDHPEKRVFSVSTYQFITCSHPHMKTGGHAGQSETLNLMAFRPELVDLTRLPNGELSVRQTGILHHSPTVEAEHNPRQVMLCVANEIRRNIIQNFARWIETHCDLHLPPTQD